MRYLVFLLALAGGLTACEKTLDPATGQTQTHLTLPLTSPNAARAEEQWRQCVQFRSKSWCRRNIPHGRPVGVSGSSQPEDGEPLNSDDQP